jgi:hypothetical protein
LGGDLVARLTGDQSESLGYFYCMHASHPGN